MRKHLNTLGTAAADVGPVKLVTLIGAHAFMIFWLGWVIVQLAPLYPSRGIAPTVAMTAGIIGVLAVDMAWIVQLIAGRASWRNDAVYNHQERLAADRRFHQACQDITVLDDAYKKQATELKEALERNENQAQTILGFGEIERWRDAHRQRPDGGNPQ